MMDKIFKTFMFDNTLLVKIAIERWANVLLTMCNFHFYVLPIIDNWMKVLPNSKCKAYPGWYYYHNQLIEIMQHKTLANKIVTLVTIYNILLCYWITYMPI